MITRHLLPHRREAKLLNTHASCSKRMSRLYPGCLHDSEINKKIKLLYPSNNNPIIIAAGLGAVKNCGGYGLGYVSEPVDGIKMILYSIENGLGEHLLVCRCVHGRSSRSF
jgi:hypothetical protein